MNSEHKISARDQFVVSSVSVNLSQQRFRWYPIIVLELQITIVFETHKIQLFLTSNLHSSNFHEQVYWCS